MFSLMESRLESLMVKIESREDMINMEVEIEKIWTEMLSIFVSEMMILSVEFFGD